MASFTFLRASSRATDVVLAAIVKSSLIVHSLQLSI
jgi:hypothetical protein